jgi:nitrilase
MVSSDSVSENLATSARLVARAADQGAQLILLPEYFCILGRQDTDKVAVRETLGAGPIQEHLANLARHHKVWILGGSLPLKTGDDQRVRNSLLAFDPNGMLKARYDKIHLFGLHHEDQHFDEARTIEPGTSPTVLELELAGQALRIGLSICYDLRFPELYRSFGRVDLIVVPSAFTEVTGRAHWDVLLRARAIENQCYVLAAAQGGVHANGRRTFGHTVLIDPWGETLALLPEGEGIILGNVDLEQIARVRRRLPALDHRTM